MNSHTPAVSFSAVIGEAWKLMTRSLDFHAGACSPLYGEVVTLTEPHLPILAHKRTRYLEGDDAGHAKSWSTELESFVADKVLPLLSCGPVGAALCKNDVADMVDSIVAEEQKKAQDNESSGQVPSTSRFDSSWAI